MTYPCNGIADIGPGFSRAGARLLLFQQFHQDRMTESKGAGGFRPSGETDQADQIGWAAFQIRVVQPSASQDKKGEHFLDRFEPTNWGPLPVEVFFRHAAADVH